MAAAAVDMLAATEEISQQIGSTVQIRIGMHTGKLPCALCYCQDAATVFGVIRDSMLHALVGVCWCVQKAAIAVGHHLQSV
jgi:hypothetical protein